MANITFVQNVITFLCEHHATHTHGYDQKGWFEKPVFNKCEICGSDTRKNMCTFHGYTEK